MSLNTKLVPLIKINVFLTFVYGMICLLSALKKKINEKYIF